MLYQTQHTLSSLPNDHRFIDFFRKNIVEKIFSFKKTFSFRFKNNFYCCIFYTTKFLFHYSSTFLKNISLLLYLSLESVEANSFERQHSLKRVQTNEPITVLNMLQNVSNYYNMLPNLIVYGSIWASATLRMPS